MTGLEGIDKTALRKLYKDSPAAKALLDHLAGRERDWSSTTVDRLLLNITREGASVSRAQLVETMRALEKIRCGLFKVGRRGHPTRFEWLMSMVSIGEFAAKRREDIVSLSDDASEEEEEGSTMQKHTYNLRRDLAVEFELPPDLTQVEAARLARFIETLPLGT